MECRGSAKSKLFRAHVLDLGGLAHGLARLRRLYTLSQTVFIVTRAAELPHVRIAFLYRKDRFYSMLI